MRVSNCEIENKQTILKFPFFTKELMKGAYTTASFCVIINTIKCSVVAVIVFCKLSGYNMFDVISQYLMSVS
jgi:hypothetical protein